MILEAVVAGLVFTAIGWLSFIGGCFYWDYTYCKDENMWISETAKKFLKKHNIRINVGTSVWDKDSLNIGISNDKIPFIDQPFFKVNPLKNTVTASCNREIADL